MKRLAVLAVLAWPCFAGSAAVAARPITLYTTYRQAPPEGVEDALHEELASIMGPSGIGFTWRALAAPHDREISIELAVIRFRGRCDTGDLLPIRINPGALGWTHVSDGTILPFSDVDCDRVRDFVQRDLLNLPAEARPAVFGRALARVLAHELYHIFANTLKHGSCGVGKASYTVEELLSDRFSFEEKESDALRAGKPQGAIDGGSGGS